MTAFKDKYYDYNGNLVTPNTVYICPLSNSTTTYGKINPYRSRGNTTTFSQIAADPFYLVLSNGVHRFTNRSGGGTSASISIVGTDVYNTIIDYTKFDTNIGTSKQNNYINDCTVNSYLNANYSTQPNIGSNNYYFKNCIINNLLSVTIVNTRSSINVAYNKCLLYSLINNYTNLSWNSYRNLSFVRINSGDITNYSGSNFLNTGYNYSTLEECEVIIGSNVSNNLYRVYDNCSFKIGSETEYTPLTGATPDELRANFISRCTAQGLTVTCPNWLFTSGQIMDGITWKDSDIHKFEVERNIVGQMGWRSERGIKIPVTTTNKANSISPANPNTNITIDEDNITLNPGLSLDMRNKGYATSNVIWLGGKVDISSILIPRVISQNIGVNMDSLPNVDYDNPVTPDDILESGKYYWLTSSDGSVATVTFNDVTYSSDQGSLNWLILGNGSSSYVPVSGSAVVYEVSDNLSYQSIGMRVIHSVPDKQLKTGQLDLGRWYMVEHDNDQSNTTDYITVAGKDYYVGSSFWVEFSNMQNGWQIVGDVHLLPLWKETEDNWMDVLPDDTRCILTRGSKGQLEVAKDSEGKYLSSGHPDFYNQVTNPDNKVGYLTGTYIQLRLPMNTKNIEYNSHPNSIDTYVNYIRGVIINAVKSTDKGRNWGQFI